MKFLLHNSISWCLAPLCFRHEKFVWRLIFCLFKDHVTEVFCHHAFSEDREVMENLPHASRLSPGFNFDNIGKLKETDKND